MRSLSEALLPRAVTLLSRAVWYTLDHPGPVLLLGLLGSGPPAVLCLMFLRESQESLLVAGQTVSALWPLAFGLAAVWFVRFPLRLALARYMAEERRSGRASLLAALGFGLKQAPSALLYGSLSTLGWLGGLALALPFVLTLRASLALQCFAAGDGSAFDAWREAGRVPATALGLRLLGLMQVLAPWIFVVLWTSPSAALGLGEWLLRLDVAALRALLGVESPSWAATAAVLAVMAAELLWSVAYGLLAANWETLSRGTDLLAQVAALEARAGEAFS
jgi:hypothetical protein